MTKTPDFKEYVKEIEELKEKHNLGSSQILMLHIAAAYECEGISYSKLKEEFTK